jgi:hypothetical protein
MGYRRKMPCVREEHHDPVDVADKMSTLRLPGETPGKRDALALLRAFHRMRQDIDFFTWQLREGVTAEGGGVSATMMAREVESRGERVVESINEVEGVVRSYLDGTTLRSP